MTLTMRGLPDRFTGGSRSRQRFDAVAGHARGMSDTREHRPLARSPRRVSEGEATFGGVVFPYRRAVRRVDDTVFVEVGDTPASVVELFEAAIAHGVAQLCLGSLLCRARPVAWDPESRGLVFDLHRHREAA